ncbi:YibE/F family protein [Amycolatopsis nalaikhensis]|uniref:YibE/F family protein n=1 Tax=Amycolatopsis nalaikhensis TaxID=715472 RepID=A0ABY8XFT6_9PSEU|nr:YibE/F family protein [Amycolatopsis sp. 2-2]WIV54487.1 YibE/F family protein [Amycolatopsis sp. 2-2]
MDRPDLDDDETGPIRRITDEVSPSLARGASGTPGTPRKPARRTPPEGTRRAAEAPRRRADTGPQRVPGDRRGETGQQAVPGDQRPGAGKQRGRRGDTGPQQVPTADRRTGADRRSDTGQQQVPATGDRRGSGGDRRGDTGPQRVPAGGDRRGDTGEQPVSSGRRTDTGPQRAARRGDTGPQRVPAATKRPAKPDPPAEAGHGHGHGHGHGPAAPASRRVRMLLIWLLAPLALATVVGMIVLYPWGKASPTSVVPQGTPVSADITATATGPCLAQGQVQVGDQADPNAKPCLTVDLTMTDGPASGKQFKLTVPIEPSTPRFAAGDAVVLAYNGGNAADPASFQLVDFQRGTPLLVLAALFAVAVLVLGRWQGLAALVALGLSFVVIALFILPAILAGENPLLVAIAGAGAIMFIALYLTHGLSARTSAAVLGTLVSLALIGVLSAIFSAAASLTGLDDSTSTLIGSLGHGIDSRGLLLAGVVIGALGVLDDVTVTQTSAVWELRRANPDLSWQELYRSGLRIGRDHVGSAVNTLVMAYAGAALPVLLYSSISGVGLGALLGSEEIAQEIVRTLAGSVGIVAAVPVTTVLAALIASREPAAYLSSTTKAVPSHP